MGYPYSMPPDPEPNPTPSRHMKTAVNRRGFNPKVKKKKRTLAEKKEEEKDEGKRKVAAVTP